MATINKPLPVQRTHEGAVSRRISAEQELKRSVMACMLFEDTFYESGQSIADRIKSLIPSCRPFVVADIAVEAREKMKLRHVPLLLARELARHPASGGVFPVSELLERIIQRPDELTEFLAIYWKEKRQPLSAQVKKGLDRAFVKFSAYQLAKYNRDGAVKLRDVMFLVHPKPTTEKQEEAWRMLAEGTLPAPDTWEVALSSGADKRDTWIRLIQENKLGSLAFLRNLRNMEQADVPEAVIRRGFEELNTERVLPYRFVAAARYAPKWEPELENAMIRCVANHAQLPGKTVLLIDVSGSMDAILSSKSDTTRIDAACGLAVLMREICERVEIFTFSSDLVRVPARRGFALRDAINKSQEHSSTYFGRAVSAIDRNVPDYDRLIAITDEQSADSVGGPKGKGYVVNVAAYKNGVGYGSWTHIDGWSEHVIGYIMELERWEKTQLSGNEQEN